MFSLICGLAVLVWNSWLIPGANWLKLDSQGFTARYWYKNTTYRWSDIKEFKVLTYRYMGLIPFRRRVAFTFSDSYPKRNIVVRLASAIAAFDGALGDNYGMKAQELMALLESGRREGGSAGVNRYTISSAPIEPE